MKRLLVVTTLLFAVTQAAAATQAEVTTNSVGSTGTLTLRDDGKVLWQVTTCITSTHMSPDGKLELHLCCVAQVKRCASGLWGVGLQIRPG
ncbi:hypothetical protein [Deinococcus sp. UYEF24]